LTTPYSLVTEDFLADLEALSSLVQVAHRTGISAKTRVASINSATLLLASTFEEFVREMGRQFAKDVVARTPDPKKLPKKLTATAWKRTLEHLARAKIDTGGTPLSLEHISADSRSKLDAVLAFLGGDVSRDIYGPLIHNDNNMRPGEINAIFAICDLSDVCKKICEREVLWQHFDTEDAGKTHGRFLASLNDFMEMRNDIAHALNAGSSVGPDNFYAYISEFKAIALALSEQLPTNLPIAPATN
jgi:hypothetical protein